MNYSISKILPYVRRYVLLGIYDVLDGEGVPYQKEEDTVVAKAEVYGNLSVFSISAEAREVGTELKVTLLQPCEGLSAQGKERAMIAISDRIVQYLENELLMNNGAMAEDWIDVTLADPDTILSAKITMFDQVSGETYYEDQFGAGIPQEDIKAGHYSTTYYNYVPDFEAYWAANGEGAFPDFAFTLTIERTDGETEEYASEHMGDGPNSISVRYEKDAGAVKVRLYNLRGEDFIPVVCGAPEDAVGETVSVTVFVDGRPIPQENYTVADETEESLVSHMDTPDEIETVTDYIRVITATLPQPISAGAKATVALDMELNGHRFTYKNPIIDPLA